MTVKVQIWKKKTSLSYNIALAKLGTVANAASAKDKKNLTKKWWLKP